jgi:glutaredoxin-related protein
MIKILDEHKVQYSTFDILQDQSVRDGLKKYSNWPVSAREKPLSVDV